MYSFLFTYYFPDMKKEHLNFTEVVVVIVMVKFGLV